MTDPKISSGTLLIQKSKNIETGQWDCYAKIGISKKMPPDDILVHDKGEILTLCALNSPMIEDLRSQLNKTFAYLRTSNNRILLSDEAAETTIISEAKKIVELQNSFFSSIQSKLHLKECFSTGRMREPTIEEKVLHKSIIDTRLDLDYKKADLSIVKNSLVNQLNGASAIPGIVRLKQRTYRPRLQKTQLKQDHKDIYEHYQLNQSSQIYGQLRVKGTLSLHKLNPDHNDLAPTPPQTEKLNFDQLDAPSINKTDSSIKLHQSYLIKRGEIARTEWLYKSLLAKLAEFVGEDDGIQGLISWKRKKKTKLVFDEQRFKTDHPELYEAYLVPEVKRLYYTIYNYGVY